MSHGSSTEQTRQEQECLKHIWIVLRDLRFDLSNQPKPRKTKAKKQFEWFDRTQKNLSELKTASYCRKHAVKLDTLADAIIKRIGPKRMLGDNVLMSPADRKKLLDRTDTMQKSIQRRMKNLHGEFVEPKPPSIKNQSSTVKLVWVLGVVSLYPLIFSTLAREFEWALITPILATIAAILSFLYFIEMVAIFIARPSWVFDKETAGRIIYESINRGLWPILLVITLTLWLSQLYWLIASIWDLVSPLGIVAATILVSVTIGLFSVILYPWTKWRYNQFLVCPVCGDKMISFDAIDTHCRYKYGFSLEQIVEYNLKLNSQQQKKTSKKERRSRTFLIMGAFYFLVEIFFFIEYGDLNAFLMLSTICVFFLIGDILHGDYRSYREMEETRTDNQKIVDKESAVICIATMGLSMIGTFVSGLAIIIGYTILIGQIDSITMIFAFNLGLGSFFAFVLVTRKPELVLRNLSIDSIPIPISKLLIYSIFMYTTNLILSLWAANTILPQFIEFSFTYGLFAGFIILLLVTREMWYTLRKHIPEPDTKS